MPNDDLRVAIYARVSGEQQAKDDTIASQLEAVTQRVASDALECAPELCFLDDGYSGDILARPGLERLRDQAAAGVIDRLYVGYGNDSRQNGPLALGSLPPRR